MAKIRGWKFPVEADEITGKIKTVADEENVRQSINIILQTEKSERKMRPYFGASMNQFMFQNVGLSLVNSLTTEVRRAIKTWEKSVTQLEVNVVPSREDTSVLYTNVKYFTDFSPFEENLTAVINTNDSKE